MRLITLKEVVDITIDVFNGYVEPYGISLMSGEVPSVMFNIHRHGTKEEDWLAAIKFKNTVSISVFKVEIWLEDVFRLCRMCRMWLITEEVYRMTVLYHMLHPIMQTQFISQFNRMESADIGYNTMLAHAGEATHDFIMKYYRPTDELEKITLNRLNCNMMEFTNQFWGVIPNYQKAIRDSYSDYETFMLEHYTDSYKSARYRKASISLIDKDGFMRLERSDNEVITSYSADQSSPLIERKRNKKHEGCQSVRHRGDEL